MMASKGKGHPSYVSMVTKTITQLNERNGSSRQKIAKYITGTYTVPDDAAKVHQQVKLALKKGVAENTFIQTKGYGATGSFKLAKEKKRSKPTPIKPKPGSSKVKVDDVDDDGDVDEGDDTKDDEDNEDESDASSSSSQLSLLLLPPPRKVTRKLARVKTKTSTSEAAPSTRTTKSRKSPTQEKPKSGQNTKGSKTEKSTTLTEALITGKNSKGKGHPSYMSMVTKTITQLNERNGSSRQRIAKDIIENYTVPDDTAKVNRRVKSALNKGVAEKKFIQTKGTGANGSFKLAQEIKPQEKQTNTATIKFKPGSSKAETKERQPSGPKDETEKTPKSTNSMKYGKMKFQSVDVPVLNATFEVDKGDETDATSSTSPLSLPPKKKVKKKAATVKTKASTSKVAPSTKSRKSLPKEKPKSRPKTRASKSMKSPTSTKALAKRKKSPKSTKVAASKAKKK